MGYAFCTSSCVGCGKLFSYNPMKVPSITIPPPHGSGTREPICLTCVERVNPLRMKNGLDPIVPLPGAYDAIEESELPYD